MNQSMFFIMSDDTHERTIQLDSFSWMTMLVFCLALAGFVRVVVVGLRSLAADCFLGLKHGAACQGLRAVFSAGLRSLVDMSYLIVSFLASLYKKGLPLVATGLSVNLVAGTGFEPVTFGL
jgi:hypothetical protein